MILSSILFGTESYTELPGIDIHFKNETTNGYLFYNESDPIPVRWISSFADTCLNSRAIKILSLGYLHAFVHEMGHALTSKLFSSSRITVQINVCTGIGSCAHGFITNSIAETIVLAAGPLADLIFSTGLIIAATALGSSIGLPVAVFVISGAALYMGGELFYIADSIVRKNDGDFGKIAREGPVQLLVSLAAVVGVCALCILGVCCL